MGEKIYGLLGRRLGHSWSVPIHQALGCEGYRLIELEPEALGDFLRREDMVGLNVTIPYKRDVMPLCDVIDEGARAIGSVNTLVRREGKLYGYNTDIDGFLYMLQRARISLTGKKVVILGSGGASLTAQAAARQKRAREIVVISRSGPDNYGNLSRRHADAQVLINTTPVGMWPDMAVRPVDLERLPGLEAVADIIYNPGRTELLLQAEELNRADPGWQEDVRRGLPPEEARRRIRWTGGLPMLVAQAVRAEELFFDSPIFASETGKIIARLWQDRTNIVLVGMPGCGKTTVGRELAALSGRTLVDLDEEIVRRAGKSIPDIFRDDGEEAFRNLEAQAAAEACAGHGQIIAGGGGVVLREENRSALRRTGRVYFLRRPLSQLPTNGRPLSQSSDLEEMYRARLPLYRAAADASVDNTAAPAGAASWIWDEFCKQSG